MICSGGFLPTASTSKSPRFHVHSTAPRHSSFCSGRDPLRADSGWEALWSPPSAAGGEMTCRGMSRDAAGETLPPLRTGDRLPSRDPLAACLCARGLRVPQRPFTQGASSGALTGECERYSRGSGARPGGVALIGDGREFKLGLRGARPLGAWLKTTTHWPTCKREKRELGHWRGLTEYETLQQKQPTRLHRSATNTLPTIFS